MLVLFGALLIFDTGEYPEWGIIEASSISTDKTTSSINTNPGSTTLPQMCEDEPEIMIIKEVQNDPPTKRVRTSPSSCAESNPEIIIVKEDEQVFYLIKGESPETEEEWNAHNIRVRETLKITKSTVTSGGSKAHSHQKNGCIVSYNSGAPEEYTQVIHSCTQPFEKRSRSVWPRRDTPQPGQSTSTWRVTPQRRRTTKSSKISTSWRPKSRKYTKSFSKFKLQQQQNA